MDNRAVKRNPEYVPDYLNPRVVLVRENLHHGEENPQKMSVDKPVKSNYKCARVVLVRLDLHHGKEYSYLPEKFDKAAADKYSGPTAKK